VFGFVKRLVGAVRRRLVIDKSRPAAPAYKWVVINAPDPPEMTTSPFSGPPTEGIVQVANPNYVVDTPPTPPGADPDPVWSFAQPGHTVAQYTVAVREPLEPKNNIHSDTVVVKYVIPAAVLGDVVSATSHPRDVGTVVPDNHDN
jgi:hypothetical protein